MTKRHTTKPNPAIATARELVEEHEKINAILAELVESLGDVPLPRKAEAALKIARDYLA